ncbi:1-phosphatidylinositol 4-kinase [Bertholletia excelsa]
MSVADVALSPIHVESVRSPGYLFGRSGHGSDESIIIYITVAGSVIPMKILESDSIASVKLRIQTCRGFVISKQKLVFGGRELAHNKSLIKDYGVHDGNFLHLVVCFSDILVITVRTACGKEFEFHVDRYRNVAYLKQRLAKKGKGFVDLRDQELFCNGEKLEDQRVIDDICKNEDATVHLMVQKSAKVKAKPVERDVEISVLATNRAKELQVVPAKAAVKDCLLEPVIVNPKIRLPSKMRDMLKSTLDGLERGKQPIRSSEGMGGTYLMQDASGDNYLSVFKPIDEEPMAVNNPQGLPLSQNGEGLKRGTRVGEGALREVAAYILDHPRSGPRSVSSEEVGFAGVPPTIMVRCLHRGFNHPDGFECALKNIKMGSLQMFVKNYGSCEDMGPQDFPVEEVHKITVFDIRMANADRHTGNILVSRQEEGGRISLIPIDHGYCLPEKFEDCTFDWLYWPQAHQPYSQDTIKYIKSLDAEKDIAILRFCGWALPLECARTLRISTMLLKKGAERGLTPFAIGSIMCRETVNKESVIEKIVLQAQDSMLPGMSEDAFLDTISEIMDLHIDKLEK